MSVEDKAALRQSLLSLPPSQFPPPLLDARGRARTHSNLTNPLSLSLVAGISCYACSSDKSWEECEQIQKIFNCSAIPGEDFRVCSTWTDIRVKDGKKVKHYTKACGATSDCDGEDCGEDCDMRCCHTDLCNESAHVMLSGIVLTACVVLHNFL